MGINPITSGRDQSFVSTIGTKTAQHTGFSGNKGAEETKESDKIKNALLGNLSDVREKLSEEEIKQLGKDAAKYIKQQMGVKEEKSADDITNPDTQTYRGILKESEDYFKLPKRQASFQEWQKGTSNDGFIVDKSGTVLTGMKARSDDEALERFLQTINFMKADQSKNVDLSDEEKTKLAKFKPTLEKWISEAEVARKKDKNVNPVFYFMDKIFKNYEKSGIVQSNLLVPALELKNSIERVNQNVYNSFNGMNSPYMNDPLMGMGMPPGMMGMPGNNMVNPMMMGYPQMAGMPGMMGMPGMFGNSPDTKLMQWMPLLMMGSMMLSPIIGMVTQSMFMGNMMGGMGMMPFGF